MKTWGFGIIGCGAIAENHLQALRELSNASLIAISDRKEQRAQEIALRENCLWTTDYKQLLDNPNVDIICLTTSSGSHWRIGMDVLESGKHLLVEKPIAMTSREAEQMIALAKERSLTLAVVSQRRFEPQHQLVKQAIDQGALGKLLLIEVACPYYRSQSYYDSASWRGTIAEDGGSLMNQGIHSIDLMLWLAGPVETVYGKTATKTHRMEAEDIGLAMLQFANGALGSFMSSTSIQPGFPPSISLFGEQGSIKIEGTSITHWSVPGMPMPELSMDPSSGGGVSDPQSISNVYHKMQLMNLLDALDQGGCPLVTGEEGREAVRLIEAIMASSAKCAEVRLG
jgi:UDP-N-acetyl-2-amino-2-deoxyglucuronate dehydrogenase